MSKILKSQSIMPRLDGIQRDLKELRKLAEMDMKEFKEKEHVFELAQFYLRRVLEGVFHIGAHLLSRLEGGRATEYKEVAENLGKLGLLDKEYAENVLVRMAGYRNRLTHFYSEVTEEELYEIIKKNLDDFEPFLQGVREVFEDPQTFGLEVE